MTHHLNLNKFFPYQLAKLQALVSDSVAEIYTGEFNLSKQEWRILAILAEEKAINAKTISLRANIEKMPTSRAINKMFERGLLEKVNNDLDKRSSLLRLSTQGNTIFQQLAPLVKKRELELLSILTVTEQASVKSLLNKLEIQALKITRKNT